MHAYLASCCGGSGPALSYVATCYVHHFAFSHRTVTRNHPDISYSCLVGGLGACLRRICSQHMEIVGLLPPENYNNAIVPGVGPLTSCLDLRVLSTWWHQLLNHNEGPASPSRFLYPKI